MTCQDVRRALHERLDLPLSEAEAAALLEHLKGCCGCQDLAAGELQLRLRLRTLPAPVAPYGLEQRARARLLVERRQRARLPAYALAASIALGVGLAFVLLHGPVPLQPAGPGSEVAQVIRDEVQPLRLVFNSPRPLAGVTLSLTLPEGVEIASRPGVRELTWRTDLHAGANVLELPVMVHGAGGVVVATLAYGNAQREYKVALKASQKSGLLPVPGTAGGLAAVRLPVSCQHEEVNRHA